MTRLRRAFVAIFLVALAPAAAAAQQAALQLSQAPYYVGIPVELHVVAEGFEEEPAPEIAFEPPAGGRLDLVAARPQVSSTVQIVNGRISQSREVRHAFVYHFSTDRPGRYTLGPFRLTQGATGAVTRAATLDVVEVPPASGQRLRVLIPGGTIFIGQRVPVTVEWWTEAGLADRLFNERLHVPLFLDSASFQFLDEEKAPSRIRIQVDVPGGTAEFPAEVRQVAEGGKTWVVRSFERTLVPVASGRFDLGVPSLTSEEAVSWQRDFFGSRVPSRSRRVRASAEPMTLEVQAVPSAGRPANFAGAIGEGFSIEVAADRTVVQAGDPVRLSITIRGQGSLDSASLPPLAAAGLSPAQFRLPEGEVAGIVADGAKRFEVSVRVLDATVREIPPLTYAWFDPSSGRFESTRSQPVALSVREASVVGAGDVVRAEPAPGQEELADTEGGAHAGRDGGAAGRGRGFTLTGADLSIETDPARLRRASGSVLGSAALAWSLYGAGLLCLASGLVVRRRRAADPLKVALVRDLRAQRSRVDSERAARDVADALRKMRARLGDGGVAAPASLDALVARLDEAVYAPGGATAPVDEALRREALSLADAMLEAAR